MEKLFECFTQSDTDIGEKNKWLYATLWIEVNDKTRCCRCSVWF